MPKGTAGFVKLTLFASSRSKVTCLAVESTKGCRGQYCRKARQLKIVPGWELNKAANRAAIKSAFQQQKELQKR